MPVGSRLRSRDRDQPGHAEVVQVVHDPGLASVATLLRIFFAIHDPTTPDRQDADVGTQYRPVIFVVNDKERRMAEAIRAEIEIVTEIAGLPVFVNGEAFGHGRRSGSEAVR